MDDPTPSAVRPRRILQLDSLLRGGGTDEQVLLLARGLARLGQAVWLAGPADRELSDRPARQGVPYLPTPPEGPLKLRLVLCIARLIRQHAVQFLHAHHGRDYWPAVLAARLSGAAPRVVITRHLAKSPASGFSRRWLLGACDRMVAVSEFTARVLRQGVNELESPEPERRRRPPVQGDPRKIEVVYGAIDTERFCPRPAVDQRRAWGLEPEHFAFGVVGGYDRPRGKGQREFLRAAARVRARAPLARFLIVGRGNLAEALRADIRELGLEARASLTPYCADMPEGMNALDGLVHPQVGTEAFGLVVLEAFACGKPVIASALDGIPEAFGVGREGWLVPPEDIGELAAALERMVHQPPLTADTRNSLARRVQAQFSCEAFAQRMLAVYDRSAS